MGLRGSLTTVFLWSALACGGRVELDGGPSHLGGSEGNGAADGASTATGGILGSGGTGSSPGTGGMSPAGGTGDLPVGGTGGAAGVTGRSIVTDLSLTFLRACALLASGRVKCWGENGGGFLGLGDIEHRGDGPGEMGASLAPVDLGEGVLATAIGVGQLHSCAVLADGGVKCWGHNGEGQLGTGDTVTRGALPSDMGDNLAPLDLGGTAAARDVESGEDHSCVVFTDGLVKCWGAGFLGQLGLGDTENRGDDTGEMGDALPFVNVGGRAVTALSSSSHHTCALLDDGSIKCWGYNSNGQLGLGDTENRGDEPGEMGDALPTVDLGIGRTATAIGAGWNHTCALLDDDSVKCWGFYDGILGLGDTEARGDDPGEMGDALPAVNLGTGAVAIALAVGGFHTCALLSGGSVKCWGAHPWYVDAGLDSTVGDTPDEMGDALPAMALGSGLQAAEIRAALQVSGAIFPDGSIKLWGANQFGQLGLGDADDRGDDPGEMGDALPFVEL